MERLSKNCHSYSVSNEVYGDFHFQMANLNGSFFSLVGKCECDYKKYDGYGKITEKGHLSDGRYEIDLSPIQFFRMAEQIFKFCNKEFGTSYPETFDWEAYPNFMDEESNYDDYPKFSKYIDYDYPLKFERRKIYGMPFVNGVATLMGYKYTMCENHFGDITWGEKPKSFFIALANGFLEYIKNDNKVSTKCGDAYIRGELFKVKKKTV